MNKHKRFPACAGVILLVAVLVLAAAGCGPNPSHNPNGNPPPTEEQIQQQATIGTTVYTEVLALFLQCLSSGNPVLEMPTEPESDPPSTSSTSLKIMRGPGDGWTGPDSQGWYTRSQKWGYGGDYWYTEKYRYIPDEKAYEYETSISYDGGDGHFSYETKYRSAINDKNLLDGYYFIITDSSGFESISNAEWRFYYSDFDKETGAGHFEWWFGANSLGSTYNTPLHCYMTIDATVKSEGWLHLHVHFYEDSETSYADWEYDCPYTPTETDF